MKFDQVGWNVDRIALTMFVAALAAGAALTALIDKPAPLFVGLASRLVFAGLGQGRRSVGESRAAALRPLPGAARYPAFYGDFRSSIRSAATSTSVPASPASLPNRPSPAIPSL